MVKDEDVYPLETVVRIKKTGQFAIVKKRTFLMNETNFLNYLGIIEGRGDGLFVFFHEDVELENYPNTQ